MKCTSLITVHIVKSTLLLSLGDNLNDPETELLLEAQMEHIPSLLATIRANKGRGNWSIEQEARILTIYWGERTSALCPWLVGAAPSKGYLATRCDVFYIPEIIKILKEHS